MMKINPTLPMVDNFSWIFPILRYRVNTSCEHKFEGQELAKYCCCSVILSSAVHSTSFTMLAVVQVMHLGTNDLEGRSGFMCL